MMKRKTLWAGLLLMVLTAIAAVAQPPPGAGGFQMTPEMQRRMEEFRKWREAHRYTFQLTSTLRTLEELDKDQKTRLTPAQAKKILAVLQPLRNKPKMTQDDAKNALKQIKAALNVSQLNAMARIEAERRNRRGGPGGAGGGMGMRPGGPGGAPGGAPGARPGGNNGARPGGPGGAGRPGGGQWQMPDPAAMKDFNPFKPDPKMGQFAQRGAEYWNNFFKGLQQRASGK